MVRAWSAMARVMAWNPPGGVRGELEALRVIELLDRADKAQVAFLDKIQEQHATTHIALGNGNHQTQVSLDELLLRIQANLLDTAQAALLATVELAALLLGGIKLGRSGHAGLYLHGQVDFLGGRQQRDLADLLQVHAHRIAGEHGDVCGFVALTGRRARRTRFLGGDLRQRHVGSGLQLLLGNSLEQILLFAIFVDVGFLLLVGGFRRLAEVGFRLGVFDILNALVDFVEVVDCFAIG